MKNIYGGHPLNGYYYNLDELKDKVSRVTSAAIYAAYISKSGRATYDYSHATDLCLRRLFNSIMKKSNVFLEMAGDSPIVVFNFAEESMAVCPLRGYHFYKVFDTYAAFQEIHSFLASKASPEKSMPVIPDVLKAQSKGFDKWSFRKPPTRKK